jgi:hypothetical protein
LNEILVLRLSIGLLDFGRSPDRCRVLPWKIRIKVERPQRSADERP